LPAWIVAWGSWDAAERGAYVMIPWRSVRHAGNCRLPDHLSCLQYIYFTDVVGSGVTIRATFLLAMSENNKD
jgi:hypothetical protein